MSEYIPGGNEYKRHLHRYVPIKVILKMFDTPPDKKEWQYKRVLIEMLVTEKRSKE